MSRTIRKSHLVETSWRSVNEPGKDSKPYKERYKFRDGKSRYRCRCECYCVMGWRHKHLRRNHPIYDGELDYGVEAQVEEQVPFKHEEVGSNPTSPTKQGTYHEQEEN